MMTKVFTVLLSLSVVVFGVLYGVQVLAPINPQFSGNRPIQNSDISVLSMPSLKEGKKDTPKQKEITDNSGITIHLGSGLDPKTKVFKKTSPYELIITDPQGRRVVYNPINKVAYNEIPRAYYETVGLEDVESGDPGPESKELFIPQPIAGDYQLQVVGTGTGTYTLEIMADDPELNPSLKKFKNISVAPSKAHTYGFYYAKTVGTELEFTAMPGNFDGKGQRPSDVNKFLSYVTPTQSTTTLPAGTTSFSLITIYDKNIISSTFTAELNGVDVKSLFHLASGNTESVTLNLSQGRNTLILSVEGNLPNRIARDTDRLVFIVP